MASLPNYLLRRQGTIVVDLSLFPVGGGFETYLDQLFSGGSRFKGLDYRVMMGLLHDYDAILDAHGIGTKVKLADDVVDFLPNRRALYRNVKIDSAYTRAEYFFEPLEIETVVESPVYGPEGPDGVRPIVGSERKSEMRPTKLDLDEFIADMWLKGVRFGIDVEKLASVISKGEMGRMTIASQLDPTEGSDAEIEEASEVLRRDNSPKILANGKADLRKFQNRFPQIDMGARLLKKKPRVLGKPGFKVNGAIMEPEVPEDLDISPLAGSGTRVEKQDGDEYIVATRDGFLSLDTETNHISVTEKIENKGGISVKTTGDLLLTGNEFIEHGEVQEGRVVEGKNMTFLSAVYGDVVSDGGLILLESNLSNGSAKSEGGEITANGRTFNSVIEAWNGSVKVKYAESCLIIGKTVQIERAVNCEILAETVQIDEAEGCGIAAVAVKIKSSGECRGKQNLISMVVPSLSILDAQIEQVDKAIADCEKIIQTKELGIAEVKADAEFAKYLTLAANIKQGVVKLTLAHQENWQRMVARFARPSGMLERLNAEKQDQLNRIKTLRQGQESMLKAREKSGGGVRCEIGEVSGDTYVRTLVANDGIPEFRRLKTVELRTKFREPGPAQARVFSDDRGSLDWCYTVPDMAGHH
jgi:hypothetical protein